MITVRSEPTASRTASSSSACPPRAAGDPAALCFAKAKEQVNDLLLVVEVGRLEHPGLVIDVAWPQAAPMAESGL